MRTLRNCMGCGEHIVVGDRFCAHCGAEQPITMGVGLPEELASRWDEIGEKLQAATEGRFHIRGLVGRGGMAAVYLADWPQMELRIAIKVMDPFLLDQESTIPRFLREARTIAKLRHRHIIRVYDSGHAEGLYYFCMDYYPGRSLERVLESEGPLPIPVVKLWLSQAADALGYAHSRPQPVVHRDVKPSNMLLDNDGDVVLTDFGIAKVRETEDTLRSPPSLTRPGAVLGTPTYLSPEQANVLLGLEGARPGVAVAASDQYSLGVVAYEMLSGQPPFTGSLASLCRAHAERKPEDIREKRPDCPTDLARIVMRMLEKDPEERWPAMEKICAALDVPTPAGSPLRSQLAGYARGRQPVGSILLRPPSGDLFVGQSLRLVATPLDLVGRPLPDRPLAWVSSDPDIALVNEEGLLRALQAGPVSITATAEGVSGEMRLSVSEVRVDTVVVAPSQLTVFIGDIGRLRAILLNQNGEELEDRETSWTSHDPGIASVDGDGTVQGLTQGATSVVASSEGQLGSASVTVSPKPVASVAVTPGLATLEVGEVKAMVCIARDLGGTRLRDRSVTWTTDEPSVVDLDQGGMIRGLVPGTATISAQCEGVSGSAQVNVKRKQVTSIGLSPTWAQLSEGETLRISATLLSADGEDLSDRSILWGTSDSGIAAVDADGRVTGLHEGSARITASCDLALASADVVVREGRAAPGPVVRESGMRPDLDDPSKSPSPTGPRAYRLSSTAIWLSGITAALVVTALILWQSSIGQVEHVPPPTPAEVVAITVLPGDEILLVSGETVALGIVALDEAGDTIRIQGPSPPRWETTGEGIVRVSQAGVLTALRPGTAGVRASLIPSDGATPLEAEATVTVAGEVAPPVARLEIRGSDSLVANTTAQYSVAILDVEGARLQEREVAWRSDDTAVADVSGSGANATVRALTPGTANLIATVDSVSATHRLAVFPVPEAPTETERRITRILIEPDEGEVEEGDTLRLHLLDQTGSRVSGTFRSSDPTLAAVSEEGLLTARSAGMVTLLATFGELSARATVLVTARVVVPDPATLDSLRTRINQAEVHRRAEEYEAGFQLLDSVGARLTELQELAPDDQGILELERQFLQTYQAVSRQCEAARSIDIRMGRDPPTCKVPPRGGGGEAR
jgi:serine/threonine protein kinase